MTNLKNLILLSHCVTWIWTLYFFETSVDPYKTIIYDNIDEFDTSDYPKDHKCYSEWNKKVVGKFKDELNGCLLYTSRCV